jgi:hypothetical protein
MSQRSRPGGPGGFANTSPLEPFFGGRSKGPSELESVLLQFNRGRALEVLRLFHDMWQFTSSTPESRIIGESLAKTCQLIIKFSVDTKPEVSFEQLLFNNEFDVLIKKAENLYLPYVLQFVTQFINASGGSAQELRKRLQSLGSYESELKSTLTEGKEHVAEISAHRDISAFVDSEEHLTNREKEHKTANRVAVVGLVVVLSLWVLLQTPLLSFVVIGVPYQSAQKSNGIVLDILYSIKVLAPTLVALVISSILLRWYSIERNSLLMLQQRRAILHLTVHLLKRLDRDNEAKGILLQALSTSMMSFYSTGYLKRGLDTPSNIQSFFGKKSGENDAL